MCRALFNMSDKRVQNLSGTVFETLKLMLLIKVLTASKNIDKNRV